MDVGHDPRKAVSLVEIGRYLEQNLHARAHRLPRHTLEMATHESPRIAPALGRSLGHGRMTALFFLHKFHVAVAANLTKLRQLGLYPILIGHGEGQRLPNQIVEFVQCQSLLHAISAFYRPARLSKNRECHSRKCYRDGAYCYRSVSLIP